MFKIKIIIILLFISCSVFNAQNNSDLSEESKVLLFTSVETDGNSAIDITYNEWLDLIENHYEYFDVKFTPIEVFYKSETLDSIGGKYELKLYKILSYNSENQSRYVLWYKDFSNVVWLRVGGYVENDFHLLLNYLKEDKRYKKQIKKMFQEWRSTDSLFAEIDWECLYSGYKKNSTKSDCFRSANYIFLNNTSFGYDPLREDQLNSIFSRVPLNGYFFHRY